MTTQITNINPAKEILMASKSKSDLELWQIFTVLTVIFLIASTFMWMGMINPKNTQNQIISVDKAKSQIYARYQSDYNTLSEIELPSSRIDMTLCKVLQANGDSKPTERISKIITDSKSDISKLQANLSSSNTNKLVKDSFQSYINLMDNNQKNLEKIHIFQIKQANLSNQILSFCQPDISPVSKQEIVVSLSGLADLNIDKTISENLNKIKNVLESNNIDTSQELVQVLESVNDTKVTTSSLIESGSTLEHEFVQNIKQIEAWERITIQENPQIVPKVIYIYDV